MDHPVYLDSMLLPGSPQYTPSEALMGAAYRRYVLKISETKVDRRILTDLPQKLAQDSDEQRLWWDMLNESDGLRSPRLTGERAELLQVIPLVPNLARFGCILGKVTTHRWDPGSFMDGAFVSGAGPSEYGDFVSLFGSALKVESGDELFARLVEQTFGQAGLGDESSPVMPGGPTTGAFAWRNGRRSGFGLSPAERMVADLRVAVRLKPFLTRRQWTVTLESVLRLGLGMHEMWLARLNCLVWDAACVSLETGATPDRDQIERWWTSHREGAGLVELGAPFTSRLLREIARLFQARLGLDLLLSCMDDADVLTPWSLREPAPELALTANLTDSAAVLQSFLGLVSSSRSVTAKTLDRWCEKTGRSARTLRGIANSIADLNQKVGEGSIGFTKNVKEFVKYVLQQLVPLEADYQANDQGYVLKQRVPASRRSAYLGCLGPSLLVFGVHACCSELGEAPGTLDDLQEYFRDYGIEASMNELQSGQTGLSLVQLGLVADSPDATSGRLLVDPFPQARR